MKKFIVVAMVISILITSHNLTLANDFVDYPAILNEHTELKIYGTANQSAIEPVLNYFQQQNPAIAIRYREFSSRELYQHFLNSPNDRPDIMLSPAMDLQFKLVNDGYALPYNSKQTERLPQWAKWRDEIFGFTFEPIVIAINTDILVGEPLPQSRAQLLNLIYKKNHLLDGKIGISDIETVGLGFLTWSHDSQQSRDYGRLLETFGRHRAKLYANSSEMLMALKKGEIFIAYNVLGSYAEQWSSLHPWITPILPTDYTSIVMRTAFISRFTDNPIDAKTFIDFLLSEQGQQVLENHSSLPPIHANQNGQDAIQNLRQSTHSLLRPIPLGLELLLQTDQAKQQILLDEWHQVMRHITSN